MFAATTSPSYSPTWVSGQMPVTSPIAQSRSPARRYSSTRIPGDRLRPRPSPGRSPRRAGAGRSPPAARRHDDMLRGVPDAVDLDDADARQPARAAQQRDAPVRQPALLSRVGVARHHEVPPGERGLHVDLRAGPGLASGLYRLARAQERL